MKLHQYCKNKVWWKCWKIESIFQLLKDTLSHMFSVASIWDISLFFHMEFSAAIQPVQTAKYVNFSIERWMNWTKQFL